MACWLGPEKAWSVVREAWRERVTDLWRRESGSPPRGAQGNMRRLPRVTSLATTQEEFKMKKIIVSLAFGASALLATAASAAPLSNGLAVVPDNGIENVRMVCDEYGRCWRERSSRRVIIRD